MLAKAVVALAGLVLLSGCAGDPADAADQGLGPDHPANPDAAVAPAAPPSATLAVVATTVPAAAAPEGTDDHSPVRHGPGHGQDHGAERLGTDASGHAHHGEPAPPTSSPATGTRPGGAASLYVCPHHPEVTSGTPGRRCPKCNMRLVKKETAGVQGTGHGGH